MTLDDYEHYASELRKGTPVPLPPPPDRSTITQPPRPAMTVAHNAKGEIIVTVTRPLSVPEAESLAQAILRRVNRLLSERRNEGHGGGYGSVWDDETDTEAEEEDE